MDVVKIKDSQWLVENCPGIREIATHRYSNQYKDHEYLGLPDSAYVRQLRDGDKVDEGHLPALTGEEMYSVLPPSIFYKGEKYTKIMEDLGEALVIKYQKIDSPNILVVDNIGMISLGKSMADICFDLLTRLYEVGLGS
jgi:hypothetical protein